MKVTAALTTARSMTPDLTLRELDLDDDLRPDEILVRTVAAGICHTDVVAAGPGFPLPRPIVLGHEGAGVVEAVGGAVTKVVPGDHVLLSYLACGRCQECVAGRPKLCPDNGLLNHSGSRPDGTTGLALDGAPVHGRYFGQSSFATRCIGHEQNATVLDHDLDLTTAPAFACGTQTGAGAVLNGLRPAAGDCAVVFGVGTVGMASVLAALVLGCTVVVAVDVVESRLRLAAELGATHTLDAREGDVVARIRRIVPEGAHVSVDTTASAAVARTAIECLRKGGRCGILGMDPTGGEVSFGYTALAASGVSVAGYPGGLAVPDVLVPRLVALHRQGRFPVDRLVGRFPFERIDEAVAASVSGAVVKPVLVFD